MDYEVESYFWVADSFVPIESFHGRFKDEDYIDGAIELKINGKSILSLKHWDLVDQLWAYLLDGAEKLLQGVEFRSYFPDQPLKINLRPTKGHAVVVTIGETVSTVDSKAFSTALGTGAAKFFARMEDVAPNKTGTWSIYKRKALDLLDESN